MKTRHKRQMTLRDVIKIVSQYSRNDHEMSLAVADLINRGCVKFLGFNRANRIVIS